MAATTSEQTEPLAIIGSQPPLTPAHLASATQCLGGSPRYTEFAELLSRYKNIGSVERFIVYRRRDLIRATKQEKHDGAGAAPR